MGPGCQEDWAWWEGWNFQPHLLTSGEWGGQVGTWCKMRIAGSRDIVFLLSYKLVWVPSRLDLSEWNQLINVIGLLSANYFFIVTWSAAEKKLETLTYVLPLRSHTFIRKMRLCMGSNYCVRWLGNEFLSCAEMLCSAGGQQVNQPERHGVNHNTS